MRAIAEFAMRSRVRSVLLTMVGIPLISPAVLALVGLRRGSSDGLFVLAWAALPVVAAAGAGYMTPLMAGLALTHFVAVLIGALVLRATRAWSWALVALTLASAVGILITSQVSGGVMEILLQAVTEAAGGANSPEAQQLGQAFASETQATGYLAWVSVISAMLALLLARWWQALLYNPGGLRLEMHQLRMPLPIAALGMLLWVLCLVNEHYVFWGAVAAFPMLVAGICLIHWQVAERGWGRGPLIALYVMLVIAVLPLAGFLCGLALIDSWIDIRARTGKKS
ncbi:MULTISPECIES: YybS family protein [Microbulbifer]|uniref:DUF2232 domain-containing protein n=1 Tax=Microbulbifer celer TaxID=435905 RepID=A0ABW3U4R8_9GAMM|nr:MULTISPECIES: hypothetical protein [Microbulbifer]UFN56741.1 hypothetical protein LPW13_14360 [Microbulbifer celer]